MTSLTEQQSEFVRHLVRNGCSQSEAAKRAGYSHPRQRAYELQQLAHIQEAIREEQCRLIDGNLANKALRTLAAQLWEKSHNPTISTALSEKMRRMSLALETLNARRSTKH